MRLLARLLPALLLVFALTGCDDLSFGSSDRYKEDFHYSYPLQPGGRISLENLNGSVDIYGWERDSVDITGTKYANTEQAMKDIKIDVVASAGSVQIRTVTPFSMRGNMGARYTLRVPRRVQLDRIISSNGGIRAEDIEGMAALRSSNGGIRITKVVGNLDVQTSNGGIESVATTGNAMMRTSNGTIRVEVNKGALEAHTSNGAIHARLVEPDASQPVRLESSNGHIELTMDAVREVRASTSNSSVVVRMPSAANARVRARTSNSSITTDFDVLVRGGVHSKHSLEGTLGSGGPLIDVTTSNGSIKLLRM